MMYSEDPAASAHNGDLVVYSNMSNAETTTPIPGASDGDERDKATIVAVVAMLSIFSVVGVVGNAVAFYIFFRRRNSSTSVVFILALAGTDFITCLITIPYTIVHELLAYHLVYDMACKTYMFLITSTVPFSAYIMVGIALDRYFCICHPFLYLVTLPRAKLIIAGMGIPALTFGIMTALMYGTYIYEIKTVANVTRLFNISDDIHLTNDEIISMLYKQLEHHPPLPGLTLDTIYILSGKSGVDGFGAAAVDGVDSGLGTPTNYTIIRYIEHIRQCVRNSFVFDEDFVRVYTKVHAAGFVLAYVIVAVLYVLIYKSIYTRRANKAKRKKNDLYPPLTLGKVEETQMSVLNGGGNGHPHSTHNANTASNTLNNQQKGGSESCANTVGAKKIVLTARNDAGMTTTNTYPPNAVVGGLNENHCVDRNGLTTKTNDEDKEIKDKVGNIGNHVTTNCRDVIKHFQTEHTTKDAALNCNLQQQEIDKRQTKYQNHQAKNQTRFNIDRDKNMSPSNINDDHDNDDDDDDDDDHRGECSNEPLLKQPSSSPNSAAAAEATKTAATATAATHYNGQPSSKDSINLSSVKDIKNIKDRESRSNSNTFMSTSPPLPSNQMATTNNNPSTTTLNSTLPSSINDLSKSCPSLYPNSGIDNSFPSSDTTSVSKDAKTNAPLQQQQPSSESSQILSTSASISPAPNPPTSLPIKITFSSSLKSKPTYLDNNKPTTNPSSTCLATSSANKPKPKHVQTDAQTNSIKRKRQSTVRHRNLVANIKTAFMLFIVTLVFLFAFLPALLMANDLIPLNLIFFYFYHIYNVVNPFIYAFMNQTFREDLKKIVQVFCSR